MKDLQIKRERVFIEIGNVEDDIEEMKEKLTNLTNELYCIDRKIEAEQTKDLPQGYFYKRCVVTKHKIEYKQKCQGYRIKQDGFIFYFTPNAAGDKFVNVTESISGYIVMNLEELKNKNGRYDEALKKIVEFNATNIPVQNLPDEGGL